MGRLRSFFGLDLPSPEVDPDTLTFDTADDLVGGADIDPAVFGLESYATATAPAPRIDRRSAIQVPAVKRCRDLVPGVLGALPLDLFDKDHAEVNPSPFAQPERSVPRSVTMTRLFEDMYFEEVGWWRVDERGSRGYPTFYEHCKPGRVSVDQASGKVYLDGHEVPPTIINGRPISNMIQFPSPTEGLLKAGARAIRTCLLLDAYAANAAQGIPPVDWFTPVDDTDPFADDPSYADSDDPVADFLGDWAASRRARTTAYMPFGLKYEQGGWDPKLLQLAEQRQHAVLEIARVGGVDPEELGVSTTSRTYSNQFDRRKAYVDFTLGLYRQAVEDRLSMGDITPTGQYVKFNLDAFLRSDPAARYASYKVGLEVGAIDQPEIRELEDKPPLTVEPPARPVVVGLPTRTEESA